MKIGLKINLIKKISLKLKEHNFSDGDLILRQFGLPTADSWQNGDVYDYYLGMIENGSEEVLNQLHEYLFPDEVFPATTAKIKTNWSEGTLRIFLSHSTTKKIQVTQVKNELKKFGIDCFVAHEDIAPTVEWLREIQTALASSHCLVAFLCNEFPKSAFCDQEVGFSIQRGILTIPVRLEIDPYGFMGPLQGVTAFLSSPEQIAQDILSILENHLTTKHLLKAAREKYIENLVDKFLASRSYSDSTELLRQLEQYPVNEIPKILLILIAQNWEKNSQITGCNGIPKRIKWLFEKHDYVPSKSDIPF